MDLVKVHTLFFCPGLYPNPHLGHSPGSRKCTVFWFGMYRILFRINQIERRFQMTKKHYKLLVKAIRESQLASNPNQLDLEKLLVRLCNLLKADNKLFDEDKFYEEVYKR